MEERNVSTCIIFDKNKRILLQKKTLDYPYWPDGPWLLPGGEIEKGETAEQAIIRELKEELCNDFDVKFFKIIKFRNPNGLNVKENTFISNFNKDISSIRINEGAGFAFFDISELDLINIIPFHFQIIKEYLKENHNT